MQEGANTTRHQSDGQALIQKTNEIKKERDDAVAMQMKSSKERESSQAAEADAKQAKTTGEVGAETQGGE